MLAWNGKCHGLFLPIVTNGFSNEKKIRVGLDFIHLELIGSLDFCHLFIVSDKLLKGGIIVSPSDAHIIREERKKKLMFLMIGLLGYKFKKNGDVDGWIIYNP